VFDLLAGVRGLLEFGATSPQRRKRRDERAEVSTGGMFDGEMATLLTGANPRPRFSPEAEENHQAPGKGSA